MHESLSGEAVYVATAQAYDDEMRERIGRHRQTRDASGFAWRTVEEPHELSSLLQRLSIWGAEPQEDAEANADRWEEAGGVMEERRHLAERAVSADESGMEPDSKAAALGEGGNWRCGQAALGEGGKMPAENEIASPSAVLVDCLTLWLSNRLLALEHDPDRERRLEDEMVALVQTAASYPGKLTLVTNEVGSGIVPEYALGRLFRDFAGRLNQRLAERAERVFLVTCGIPVELKSLQYRFE
jgi:adenosylcobinamide kinase/adenosylcobinamide-phosphate guanylyltransferase